MEVHSKCVFFPSIIHTFCKIVTIKEEPATDTSWGNRIEDGRTTEEAIELETTDAEDGEEEEKESADQESDENDASKKSDKLGILTDVALSGTPIPNDLNIPIANLSNVELPINGMYSLFGMNQVFLKE